MSGTGPINGNAPIDTSKAQAAHPAAMEARGRLLLSRLYGQASQNQPVRSNPLTNPADDDTAPHLGRHLDVTA